MVRCPTSLSLKTFSCRSPNSPRSHSAAAAAAAAAVIKERKSYNVTQSRPLISKRILSLTVMSFPSLRHTRPTDRPTSRPATRIKRQVLRNSPNARPKSAGRPVRCLRHLRAGKRLLFIGSDKAEDDCAWQILPGEEKRRALAEPFLFRVTSLQRPHNDALLGLMGA